MKKLRLVSLLLVVLLLSSCADSRTFIIDNEIIEVEPYGWWDLSEKNDSIKYEVNTGNIILSVLFSETIIIPLILTGGQLYEPISKKQIVKATE